jgi:hypothetical protein
MVVHKSNVVSWHNETSFSDDSLMWILCHHYSASRLSCMLSNRLDSAVCIY